MTQYANTAEGGTSGTTVTIANSGGASGDAWTAVTTDPTCDFAFSNTHAAHGSLAYHVVIGSTPGVATVEKNLPAASLTAAVRFYIYMTGTPAHNITVLYLLNGTTVRSWISIDNARHLFLRDASGSAVIVQTGVIPLNQWVRVEAQWPSLSNTVGQATLSRFDTMDSSTATETATSAASQAFGGSADRMRWGSVQAPLAGDTWDFWLDDIAENDTGAAIGPVMLSSLSSETVLSATLNDGTTPLNAAGLTSETVLSAAVSTDTLIHAAQAQSEQTLAATLSLYQPLGTWTGDDDLRFDSAFELDAWLFLEPTEVSPPTGTHVSDLDQVSVTLPTATFVNGVPVGWTPTVTRSKWGRFQIIVAGTDVTNYRGKRTAVASYASNDPFGDADATLHFPQITEYDDRSTIPWWTKGAEVTIRRRHPDGTKSVVWEGLLASEEPGREAHCLGVLYQLDLYIAPRWFYDEARDVGQRIAYAINHRARNHGFKGGWCTPVDTGIDTRQQGVGDPMLTSYIQNIISTAQTTSGQQWTLALDHPRKPVIRLRDATTQHWTADNGAPGVTPSLSRDYTQETNVEFGQGSSGDCYWENRKFPHLHVDTAPLYPLTLPAVFTAGDGHTGFDAFADELRLNGRSMDSADTYLASDVDSVEDFQTDAGITVDGIVGPQTWAAAFQSGSHQGDLTGVWVKPLAELSSVEPYLFNAQGAQVGENPAWDRSALRIEKMTLFGDRVPKTLGRAAAKQMLARDHVGGHLGTITLTSDPAEGSRRDIQAGQNIRLRRYQGANLLFHIARAEWDEAGQSMTLTVDTKARDLMTVASVHQRNRDVADPVGRPKPGWRTGTQVSDRVQWACEDGAGKIPFHAQQGGLWTVMRIPTGEFGQIAKLTLAAGSGLTRGILNDLLADPPPSGYHNYVVPGASKLAVAVFAGEVTPNMLANLLGNPLANNAAGNNPWDDNADQLDDWGLQYAAGGPGQAGGFYPHTDPGNGTTTGLTGRFVDANGWPFAVRHIPWMYVAVYAASTCYVGGRMYPGAPS